MKETIKNNHELCTGCNRCVRECPMEMANITYQDEAGNIKVKIDHTKCITCGRCVSACKHNARQYIDDTERFFDDLSSGVPISLIAAPAIHTNIPDYKKLFTCLKKLGVNRIYDVSLGADICVWAHIRHIEKTDAVFKNHTKDHKDDINAQMRQKDKLHLITQPCPAIVSYCEMYRHDLLKYLSPVQSPMASIAIYMKKYEGITDRIAALSPCIAKADEFEATGLTQYNVTFARLREYIENNKIEISSLEETGFDHYESAMGAVFPMPGGLKENIEFFLGKSLCVDKAEGYNVYERLKTYAETPNDLLPEIFDVLNCHEGCNIGSAGLRAANIFEINRKMDKRRKNVTDKYEKEYFETLYKEYDAKFDLSDFMREYRQVDTMQPSITDADIEKAFELLGKNDYEKQNVDCGACGSDTCHNMARKIALGVNIPIDCIVKTMEDAKIEHEKNLESHEQLLEMEKMREADERMRIMLNANPLCTQFWDRNFNIIDCNDEVIKLYKLSSRQEYMERFYELSPEFQPDGKPSREKAVEVLEKAFKKGYNSFEWLQCLLDGEPLPVEVVLVRVEYRGENLVVGYTRDLREQKRSQKQLENAVNEAKEASIAKSSFLANMSHEIRTPMNAIIGMAQIALKTNEVEKLKYCLSNIENSSTHLLGVINDILDMSKIEAGKLELESTPLNMEKMLIKVCNLVNEKVEQKNIKFNINLGVDMRMNYIGDELRLSQVITNLLSNALKFTPNGGTIEVSVEEKHSEKDHSIVRFAVNDTGIGMTQEQMDKLFTAFQQAESGTTRKFGGTGLGLAISKSIVENMHGRIWVESELEKGSSFIFEVKLERPKHTAENIRLSDDIKLLIADPDDNARKYFKAIINSFGIKSVDETENVEQTVELAVAAMNMGEPYDIIYTDYSLVDERGIEFIKNSMVKLNKNSVVVMATFFNWDKIETALRAIGINKFVAKPLFPSAILDSINKVIGGMAKNLDEKIEDTSEIPDFSNIRLLLAEDVEINREVFYALFEDTKANIDAAENGLIAVEKFKQSPDKYDIIIMDIQMPEMDGYQATKAIRALDVKNAKTIPIIAMTANVFKEDIENCIASGMNDHLSKPIDMNAVIEKIKFWLRANIK